MAATYRDIRTIDPVTPQPDAYSYGLGVFGGWLGRIAGSAWMWDAAVASPAQLVAFVGLACLLAAALQVDRDRSPERARPAARR